VELVSISLRFREFLNSTAEEFATSLLKEGERERGGKRPSLSSLHHPSPHESMNSRLTLFSGLALFAILATGQTPLEQANSIYFAAIHSADRDYRKALALALKSADRARG
jgi:hypothetical protein